MAGPVSWHVELRIRPGCRAAFLALNAEMIEATRTEPGALLYERYLAADDTTIHVLERYVDCGAAAMHLRVFGERFAARFGALVERIRFEVFGSVDAELRMLLDAVGATYAAPLAGFDRGAVPPAGS